ncbi:mitochondrial carrier [Atractiella rhizophila]|nr:mitochondrial carrier [Atractiella rhizophila]
MAADTRKPSSLASTSADPLPPHSPHVSPELRNDLIAGWLGGALGILLSNPFEVLKVRLQTLQTLNPSHPPSTRVGAPSTHPRPRPSSSSCAPSLPSTSTSVVAGLRSLWRTDGYRFLYAGAAGPILGLALIDSAFFGIYGLGMKAMNQDREEPNHLGGVVLAGANAGGICALLQTPIEVVKCRAQAEESRHVSNGELQDRKKLGSLGIARTIIRGEGIRGFYIGGLMTISRDAVSSGIFFGAYHYFRRVLPSPESPSPLVASSKILLSGGLAGAISALIPYPIDIIKTRLQVTKVSLSPAVPTSAETLSLPPPQPSVRQIARQIYREGLAEGAGYMAFLRGLKPTLVSAFVGSAVTIGVFEAAVKALE